MNQDMTDFISQLRTVNRLLLEQSRTLNAVERARAAEFAKVVLQQVKRYV